tara:strand:+ start:391 stop:2145 length:1755 start_codon:yes stop_codon:yes gene_type:complete
MSAYGTKVVAIIEPQSDVGQKLSSLFTDVQSLKNQMTTLLADAPETLDTLNEIAAAISDDPAFFTTMSTANTTLQNNIDTLSTAASTARTALQTLLQAAIDANKLTSDNAESLLSGRLDTLETDPTTATALAAVSGRVTTLEADPTTATAVAAVQADVDQNETDADAADAALSARIATLEADPTTKTYVDTQITGVIDASPGALDTLNELAAALNDDANFATTITNSVAAVQADVNQNETDADAADAALSARIATLEADPTTAAAVAAVQADVDANEADHDAAIALKFDKTGGQITGNLAIAKNWPDVELKSGDEKRILFADAGGAATAALKHVSGSLDFYVGGIASGNKEMSLDTDGLDVTALKIDGTAVSATAAEINAFDGRLDTLEADPTTAAAVAAVQADVDQNETDADAAIAAVQADVDQNESDADAAIAAVQADVDQNEADADTAIALKADTAGDTFTGDILLKNPSGNAVALRLSRADHPDMSCEWKISPSYVSSSKECLSVLAAGQPVAHFDERQRVSINKTDPDHTLDVAGDAKFSTGLHVGGLTDAANDSAAATAGVAVGQVYRNGSVLMIRVS